MRNIWKFIEKHRVTFSTIASIIAIIIFCATIINYIYKTPHLTVEIEQEQYSYPKDFHRSLLSISNYLQDITENRYVQKSSNKDIDSLYIPLKSVLTFLSEATTYWKFTIKNTTTHDIRNIDIRIPHIYHLIEVLIEGNAFTEAQEESLFNKIGYEGNLGLLIISGINRLPPKSSIVIKLWGIKGQSLWLEPEIAVYSSEGVGRIVEPIEVVGTKAFLVQNLEKLTFLFILAVLVILIRIKPTTKSKRNVKKI